MRILLIEDDTMIADAVAGSLKDSGYAVDWINNGRTAVTAFGSQSYDLILLDLGLPGQDGLDGGADDYLIKPFDMAELQARIRAVLRRQHQRATPLLGNGSLALNPAAHQVEIVGQSEPVALSNKEFAILEALLQRPGTILSRSSLEDKIYGWGEEVESNAIDYLIHALRKKIGKEHIKNIRGVGWMVPKEPQPD